MHGPRKSSPVHRQPLLSETVHSGKRPASIALTSTWDGLHCVVVAAIGERALVVGEADRARSPGSALMGASFNIWH